MLRVTLPEFASLCPRGELGPGAGPAGVELPEIQGDLKTQ